MGSNQTFDAADTNGRFGPFGVSWATGQGFMLPLLQGQL